MTGINREYPDDRRMGVKRMILISFELTGMFQGPDAPLEMFETGGAAC